MNSCRLRINKESIGIGPLLSFHYSLFTESRFLNGKRLFANTVFVRRKHLPQELFGHIDQGALFIDVDFADGIAGDVGMVGNRANHIRGTDAVHFTHAH